AKRALQRSAMLLAGRWHGTRVSRHRIGPVRIGVAICHVLLASGCAMNTPRPQRQAGLESATWALEMCRSTPARFRGSCAAEQAAYDAALKAAGRPTDR